MWSKETLGYVAPVTETNEMYVATLMVQKWLKQGYSENTIFRKWNGGDGSIKSGINAYGQEYDTKGYELKALSYLR